MGRPPKVSTDEILDTTRRLFAESGSSVPLSEIASELGISAPALIGRFGTKENLIRESVGKGRFEAWAERLQSRRLDDRPLPEQLREIWDESVELIQGGLPVMAGLVQSDLRSALRDYDEPPPAYGRRILRDWLSQVPDERKSTDWEASKVADLMISSAEGAALNGWLFPEAEVVDPSALFEFLDP